MFVITRNTSPWPSWGSIARTLSAAYEGAFVRGNRVVHGGGSGGPVVPVHRRGGDARTVAWRSLPASFFASVVRSLSAASGFAWEQWHIVVFTECDARDTFVPDFLHQFSLARIACGDATTVRADLDEMAHATVLVQSPSAFSSLAAVLNRGGLKFPAPSSRVRVVSCRCQFLSTTTGHFLCAVVLPCRGVC